MSGTIDPNSPANTGPSGGVAVGGGGNSRTSVGGSTLGLNLPELPPQYSTGNAGFPTRSTESVPTDVTVGPDGALYVSAYTGLPYGRGYGYIARIANPTATTGYDGKTPSGVPQTYANGFTEVQSVGFNNSTGDMFVLEYLNGNQVYDPTLNPKDLPPSALIQVKPDGTRATINGPELHLANKLLVNQKTGDVFVSIDNQGPATATTPGTGEVLRYHRDPGTGAWTSTVAAGGLNNPTGLAFGPDGNLYALEAGSGSPTGTPGADTAPVIPFIPGLVSERAGYTGSITRVDLDGKGIPTGTQDRVLTGLASFREFNPTTGQDRVISIGQNGLAIAPDGTVYIAAGGGLAPETADAVAPYSSELRGVLKIDGLFGGNPSQATVTPKFDMLTEAYTQSPDGAITAFNTESNANGLTIGADGKLYVVDAARNDFYGLTDGGSTLDSVTVLQKQPPILPPPQYAGAVAYGGNPAAQYRAEINSYTTKDANNSPNVPGNLPASVVDQAKAAAAAAGAGGLFGPGGSGSGTPSSSGPAPHGEDTQGSGVTGATSTSSSGSESTAPNPSASLDPPSGLPPLPPGGPSVLPPVPVDPVAPPVLPNNLYTPYFNPFFGNWAPAPSDPLALRSGATGTASGPARELPTLTPGESWTWTLTGQLTPAGADQALPLSGSMFEDVEVLPFQGGSTLAFVSTQSLTAGGAPLFGDQPMPPAIFYFQQDPTTHTVYVVGDNQGPGGEVRVPEHPIEFIPGRWSLSSAYDDTLIFPSGETVRVYLYVDGTTTVTTPLGDFAAWVAPNGADESSGVSHPGIDYWTPELGAPAVFTTATALPDGSSISITGTMTATTVPSSPGSGQGGSSDTYYASKLVVFGDRLADNGNAYQLAQSLGQGPTYGQGPYSPTGNFSDGTKWTDILVQYLDLTGPSQQGNYAFESATARNLGVPNPFDPNANITPLDTFAGQIAQFEKQDGALSPDALVSVTFGGNDISLPSTVAPEQGVTDSVNAIISGLQQLANDGAKHFLVSNLADVTLAPLFNDPGFQQATGATVAQFQGLVNAFNTQLAAGLTAFKSQTGLDVKTLDLHAVFNGIANDPSAYGFTNITQPVLITPPGSSVTPVYNPAIVGQDPAVQHGSLFLDPYFDPTELGQAIMAQTARSTLTGVA